MPFNFDDVLQQATSTRQQRAANLEDAKSRKEAEKHYAIDLAAPYLAELGASLAASLLRAGRTPTEARYGWIGSFLGIEKRKSKVLYRYWLFTDKGGDGWSHVQWHRDFYLLDTGEFYEDIRTRRLSDYSSNCEVTYRPFCPDVVTMADGTIQDFIIRFERWPGNYLSGAVVDEKSGVVYVPVFGTPDASYGEIQRYEELSEMIAKFFMQ